MAHVRGYTRKVHGKLVHVRGFTRNNPGEQGEVGEEYMGTNYPNQNPDLLGTFTQGSSITQDVGGLDLLVGAISFLINDGAVKMLGLKGWTGVLGAGIVPFISASIAGMLPGGKLGMPAFFGGQMHTTLRFIDAVSSSRVGLSEGGQFKGITGLGLPLLSSGASATQLVDRSYVSIPADFQRSYGSSRPAMMGR